MAADDPAGPVPAIGYIRVSMMREEQISPDTQRAAIEDWARRRGRKITDWVSDLDKTGRNFKRKIMEVIERVEAGEVREIAVWKYSRFGRNRPGVAVNLARLEKGGGQLQSATEDVDARTATGKFTRGMLFEVAAFESDRAGETWREAYDHRLRDGLPPFGRPRFGYQRLGRVRDEDVPQRTRREKGGEERYVPDPASGPLLAAMYRRYTDGTGSSGIAGELNAQGIRNASGRTWTFRGVLDVLDSGFGAGLLRVHSPACRCGRPEKCRERAWLPGAHQPVIGAEEWDAYRDRRSQVRTMPPRHRNPAYPVSGLVRCVHCGYAMTADTHGSGSPGFRCVRQRYHGDCPGHPSVPVAALMAAVREWLELAAADVDAQAAATAARAAAAVTAADAEERLGRDLAAAVRGLANLAVQRARGEWALPGEAWDEAAAELEAERARLEAGLAAARKRRGRQASGFALVIEGILDGWDMLPPGDLNRMLRTLVARIEVRRLSAQRRGRDGRYVPAECGIEVVPAWMTDD